jgi:hypothetical protein
VTLTVEALRLKIDPWRAYSQMAADNHFEEELDPDPDLH